MELSAAAKHRRLAGLHTAEVYASRCWRSDVRATVSAGLVSSEASVLADDCLPSACVRVGLPPCVRVS